jgi:starch synthase (maltosyl-transferring)
VRTIEDALAQGIARQRPWPDQPVPIALVITDLDVGGAERALVNLATRLDRSRWAPRVIALGVEGRLAETLREAGIPCACLGGDRRKPLRVITRLAKALRAQRPALVQSFLFHANLASRLAAPFAGRPWVLGGLRVAERRKRWHLVLDRLTSPLAAGSVCVSNGVRDFSMSAGGLNPRRLVVIPNGIDPEPFDRAVPASRSELGILEDAFLAVAVGRLDEQKGIPDLLDAAELVVRERPEWHLAIAGDGPLRDWLREQLAARGALAGRVHWLGPRDDVPRLLRAADLMVLASLWEGMPNVVLEAMASGLPVVATAVEGTDELIVSGRTGWLVPPGDSMSLANSLMAAARDPSFARELGRRGRARIAAEFSIDGAVAAYERLWAGLLGYRIES